MQQQILIRFEKPGHIWKRLMRCYNNWYGPKPSDQDLIRSYINWQGPKTSDRMHKELIRSEKKREKISSDNSWSGATTTDEVKKQLTGFENHWKGATIADQLLHQLIRYDNSWTVATVVKRSKTDHRVQQQLIRNDNSWSDANAVHQVRGYSKKLICSENRWSRGIIVD